MDQPLGNAVGNALVVEEAILTLRGEGPPDFVEHVLTVATEMLLLGGVCDTESEGREVLLQKIRTGEALDKFGVLEDSTLMPRAGLVELLPPPRKGAGRQKKGDPVDLAVGVVLYKKVGDAVEKGEPLLSIHANAEERLAQVRRPLTGAYAWSESTVPEPRPFAESSANSAVLAPEQKRDPASCQASG
jgi:pyrimidine-nucleoside phosphorylase